MTRSARTGGPCPSQVLTMCAHKAAKHARLEVVSWETLHVAGAEAPDQGMSFSCRCAGLQCRTAGTQ